MITASTSGSPIHPGAHVRQHVIPKEMTVTKAAQLLGIGRPALSNFLNGKAGLSPEMAERLARVFGASREFLLDMQVKYDRHELAMRRPVVHGRHAPTLVRITAARIQDWAGGITARQTLPVLLRRLIHSTGLELSFVDCPAFDNAERKGWDGKVEAQAPTPWIPGGESGWELSCNQRPEYKAEQDYKNRVKKIPLAKRRGMTFVFVTSRNWPGKGKWVAEKNAAMQWADVRAYDASDLEQWLEQSAETQIWFAEQLGEPVSGYRTLDLCWSQWASVCAPILSKELFDAAVEQFSKEFKEWFEQPPERSFIVAADSRGEALAFLHCLIDTQVNAATVVFDTPAAVRRFGASAAVPRIVVINNPEVEHEIGDLLRRCHCIIVRLNNAVESNPDICLRRLSDESFAKALRAMGVSEDKIGRLARESARSPTILRRRLSSIPAIQTPAWAEPRETARRLLPAVLLGTWDETSQADREAMLQLASAAEYHVVEENIAALLALEDAPLWSAGAYRGVVSRVDALFGIARFVMATDLEKFFSVAASALSKTDSVLAVPESERRMAAIPEEAKQYSAALRYGISETLVLLAVFGDQLFQNRLGVAVAPRISSLVHSLLVPSNTETLLSQTDHLPNFAEAAPEAFLALIERNLRENAKAAPLLARLAKSALLGLPFQSTLLRAFECLAWAPSQFPRVVEILAKLCKMTSGTIPENYANRPKDSLSSLFRSWLPQTAATLHERIRVFEKLCRDYPALGWDICVTNLHVRGDSATTNYRPRWRDDAENAGYGTTISEHCAFQKRVRDLALGWPNHDENTLSDLIHHLEDFPEPDQLEIWNPIDRWIDSIPPEEAKAYLRQSIRRSRPIHKKSIAYSDRETAILARLQPTDLILRYASLFSNPWSWLPPDYLNAGEYDYRRIDRWVNDHQLAAIREIWIARGFEGVAALLERGAEARQVGNYMAETLKERRDEEITFVRSCIEAAAGVNAPRYKECLAGFLRNADQDLIATLVETTSNASVAHSLLTVLLCLPYGVCVWRWLDDKPKEFQRAYWQDVKPRIWRQVHGKEEINRTIDELLAVDRAWAAFNVVRVMWDKVDTARLTRLLAAVAVDDSEIDQDHTMTAYYVTEAFEVLNNRPDVTIEEKAKLELAHVQVLRSSKCEFGTPNLEEILVKSPQLFAQAILYRYKRADGGENPLGLQTDDSEQASILLDLVQRLPGSNERGDIDTSTLKNWIAQVRTLCARHDLQEVGDVWIGRFLAQAHPPDFDKDVWPEPAVSEMLEWMGSETVKEGFVTRTLGARGVFIKAVHEGGEQERRLAEFFRGWAYEIGVDYPFASSILRRIARTYDGHAERADIRADVRQWVPYHVDVNYSIPKFIADYADTWRLLREYDEGQLEMAPAAILATGALDYAHAVEVIAAFKRDLMARDEASDLFGNSPGDTLRGILGNLEQTMFGEQLYHSCEEKAANLLYFVVKDHPFIDGNKRIGSLLFLLYLQQEGIRHRINPQALTTLTLLIAQSPPTDKDLMVRLVLNLL